MTYDPNEARDNQGQWTAGSDSEGAAAEAERETADGQKPLEGLPQKPIKLGNEFYVPGPNARLRNAAANYMKEAGIPYHPPTVYEKLDKERAGKIAQAFEDMKHDPNDPKVKASYDALAKEVLGQWQALKATGLKVEWIKPGQKDPYADSPRRAAMDVSMHNHWWGFPTDQGFGSGPEAEKALKDNPMLRMTNEMIDGKRASLNDIFRIVHDQFGHMKEGNGFRGEGEENAWRSHAAMFSDLARGAMTSETRGQNSWVNYGPYGAFNRTATAGDTHYAPQKIGLMPEWTWNEGRQ